MLTPEYMASVADASEKVAAELHDDIVKAITKRLMARVGRGEDFKFTATDKWNIETLQQAGYLYEDIVKEISKKTGQTQAAVKKAMLDAGTRTLEYDQKIYDKLGIEPIDATKSPQYMSMMEADYAATNGTLTNLTGTTADSAQRMFINQCDNVYMAVSRGTESYASAVAKAIEAISESDGIYVTYTSGARMTVEAAVARCVRTGIAQMAGHVSEQRAKDVGCEHYLVSSHLGARPSHAEWQGKVYKINGSDDTYQNFREATGYGTGAGLCGWNCRHSFSPFFPEFMTNNFDEYSVKENEEAYNARQEEKAQERKLRDAKRKATAFKEAAKCAEDDGVKKVLKGKQEEYEQKVEDIRAEQESVAKVDKNSKMKLGVGSSFTEGKTQRYELGQINVEDTEIVISELSEQIRFSNVENAIVIDKNGNVVHFISDTNDSVDLFDVEFNGATILHNHPEVNGIVSFGEDDFDFLRENQNINSLRCCNTYYDYSVKICNDISSLSYSDLWHEAMETFFDYEDDDMQHIVFEILKKKGYVKYERRKR